MKGLGTKKSPKRKGKRNERQPFHRVSGKMVCRIGHNLGERRKTERGDESFPIRRGWGDYRIKPILLGQVNTKQQQKDSENRGSST